MGGSTTAFNVCFDGKLMQYINKKNKLDFRRIGDENRVLARSGGAGAPNQRAPRQRAPHQSALPLCVQPERAVTRSQVPSRVLRRAFSPPEAPSNKKEADLEEKREGGDQELEREKD
ncbi:hypothetical protein TIFTF001_029938 [Ficus carica]|uniref:Uncharacterized protein n=1 Tax=Ficus carica TaxID=3494 RepID=A0AA88DWP3_FICCA|nr:hypothetical protein TIFTF001_029938 [Ficus carica]